MYDLYGYDDRNESVRALESRSDLVTAKARAERIAHYDMRFNVVRVIERETMLVAYEVKTNRPN